MTAYSVNGLDGKIAATQQDKHADHPSSIDSVMIVDGEQRISLTAPSALTFSDISWRFRVSDAFDERDLRTGQLEPLYLDTFIDGFTGYTRDGAGWYTKEQGYDESFEVHGGVDGAWWQLLFLGQGKALFTNGQWSEEVTIESGSYYLVAMTLGYEGVATATLIGPDGETMASGVASGLSVSYSESYLGASGTVFNIVGDSLPASPTVCTTEKNCKRSPGQTWDRSGSSGYDLGYWVDTNGDERPNAWDVMTHQLGTCAGITATDWVRRPYWASCEGRLDFTFYNNRTVATWYKFTVDEIPAGYSHLEWRPKVAPDNANGDLYGPHDPCDWLGADIFGYGASRWPRTWRDGFASGGHIFAEEGWQFTSSPMLTPVEYLAETFYLGIEPGRFAEMPPWYICGGGFDWPWRVGGGNSWRGWVASPDQWEFRWVNAVQYADELALECDEIALVGVDGVDGRVIIDDNEPKEGWNTEMLEVEGGQVEIGATPVAGTVNVFTMEGELLDYPAEWEEADDLGRLLDIRTDDEVVTVVYFVSRPTFTNRPNISRPTLIEIIDHAPRGPETPFA